MGTPEGVAERELVDFGRIKSVIGSAQDDMEIVTDRSASGITGFYSSRIISLRFLSGRGPM